MASTSSIPKLCCCEVHILARNESYRLVDHVKKTEYVLVDDRRVRVTRVHYQGETVFRETLAPSICHWISSGLNASVIRILPKSGIFALDADSLWTGLHGESLLAASLYTLEWISTRKYRIVDLLTDCHPEEVTSKSPLPTFETVKLSSAADLQTVISRMDSTTAAIRSDALFLRLVRFSITGTSCVTLVSIRSGHALTSVMDILTKRADPLQLTTSLLSPLLGGNCRPWVVADAPASSEVLDVLEKASVFSTACSRDAPENLNDFELIESVHALVPLSPVNRPSPAKAVQLPSARPSQLPDFHEHSLELLERVTRAEIALRDSQLENKRLTALIGSEPRDGDIFASYEDTISTLKVQLHQLQDENVKLLLSDTSDLQAAKKLAQTLKEAQRQVTVLEKERRNYTVGQRCVTTLSRRLHACQTELGRREDELAGIRKRNEVMEFELTERTARLERLLSENEALRKISEGVNLEIQTLRAPIIHFGSRKDFSLVSKFVLPTESKRHAERSLSRASSFIGRALREVAGPCPQALPQLQRAQSDISAASESFELFTREALKLQAMLEKRAELEIRQRM